VTPRSRFTRPIIEILLDTSRTRIAYGCSARLRSAASSHTLAGRPRRRSTNLQFGLALRAYLTEGQRRSYRERTLNTRGGPRRHYCRIDMPETHYDSKDMWPGRDWIKLMLQTNLQRHVAMHFSHVFSISAIWKVPARRATGTR